MWRSFSSVLQKGLSKHESEYSWNYSAKRDEEVDRLLNGILSGRSARDCSIGFLTRCRDDFPESFSWSFLRSELQRRFEERRFRPRPDFQLSLDYVQRLDGYEFEEWLETYLRATGISGVYNIRHKLAEIRARIS